MNIKNDEAQRLARQLADLTGESLTAAITVAVRERLGRIQAERETTQTRAARIRELGRRIAEALPPDVTTIEELYDERGLPT